MPLGGIANHGGGLRTVVLVLMVVSTTSSEQLIHDVDVGVGDRWALQAPVPCGGGPTPLRTRSINTICRAHHCRDISRPLAATGIGVGRSEAFRFAFSTTSIESGGDVASSIDERADVIGACDRAGRSIVACALKRKLLRDRLIRVVVEHSRGARVWSR
jgi:hypothetical protein